MDVLMLSRLQFAVATMFHFLFVPLTLGLSILTAIYETMYVRTSDPDYKRAAKFWGKLFLINFALGVVTGITLEFQFGTNWSRYSKYVGDIFGSLLAIEATLAFYMESTFIGVWLFTWDKVRPGMHAFFIWLVAIASNISALWILIANGWMQHPVGYVMRNGRAELDDFMAVVTNKFAALEFLHTVSGAYILAGFFVMGVSAYHLLRKNETGFFKKSFSVAASFALIFALLEAFTGDASGVEVAHTQPAKLAAMESHWETGSHVPMYLFAIPDPANEKNSVETLPVPDLLSLLAFHDPSAEVKGLKDFSAADRPPVTLIFLSFRIMVGLGTLLVFLAAFGWLKRKDIERYPGYLRLMMYAIALPYLAIETGWVVAEVGRQPWIVYGVMKTADAVSILATSQVAVSLAAFVALYSFLGAIDFYLLAKYARKGPIH
ncbi:MAG: cytochrome ubiquinol oxidase subunit I [Desulfobacteraceae bacterium]|nr:cytochrome ubiquinol oxidase subunit I [Desulfobacteraceae bacterium]